MQFFLPPNLRKKKKYHKQKVIGHAVNANVLELTTGIAGLKAIENGRLTPKQLEATRRVISRKMLRTGKIIFRVSPNIAVTKKPKEVRMGKGKGAIKLWVTNIKAGCIIVEIVNTTNEQAKEILTSAATKLPVQTLLVFQNE